MNDELRAYITIPTFMIMSRKVSFKELLLFGIISNLANAYGYCWADNKYLADILGMSETSVSHSITNLNRANYISVAFENDDKSKRKIFVTDYCKNAKKHLTSDEGGLVKNNRGIGKNLLGDRSKITNPPHNNIYNNNLIQKQTLKTNNKNIYVFTDVNTLSSSDKNEDVYTTIIEYLNQKANRKFKVTANVKSLINGRITDGFTVDDFKKVIDNKCADWLGNEKMEQYLRPATLFCASKFDGYLNQVPKNKAATMTVDDIDNWQFEG